MQGKDTDTEDVLRTQGKGNVGCIGGAALMSIHSAERQRSRKLPATERLSSVSGMTWRGGRIRREGQCSWHDVSSAAVTNRPSENNYPSVKRINIKNKNKTGL